MEQPELLVPQAQQEPMVQQVLTEPQEPLVLQVQQERTEQLEQ